MTINKSQGQTFDKVGIYLPQPVFNHGQLYVAFSRATSREGIRVSVEERDGKEKLVKDSEKVITRNVVYKEVING